MTDKTLYKILIRCMIQNRYDITTTPLNRVCLKIFLIPKPQLGNVEFWLAKLGLSKQESFETLSNPLLKRMFQNIYYYHEGTKTQR